ncbi:MAG: choice-of-anchor B family protein [Bacteroidetes bacterium]|nr:choice-of-anchor B family protein [Bacteroidota bacterium]
MFGTLNPEPIHYAGCWGYTSPDSNEYALIGAYTGTSIISIDDSTNILQVDFITGPASNWREITVIGDHAFVVTEGTGTGEGLQVIDLSSLPDSVSLVTTYSTTFTRAHIISKDIYFDSNYVYVSGTTTTGGVHIIDVSNPVNPVEVGLYAPPYYIHDAHVRGNRLYASAFYNSTTDIVDISDKTNPTLIAQIIHQYPNIHSCWTTKNEKYLFVTYEQDGLYARIFNIEDLNDIYEAAQYSGNLQSLVHNPYILGDYAFISHNTEGLRIVDITDPEIPVEVGYYDTDTGASGGFSGLWSAYPYFPSGKIIGANRSDGLYIMQFNNTKAGRIYGTVSDSLTGNPILSAQITIIETGKSVYSDSLGIFKSGALASDSNGYTLSVSAVNYQTTLLNNIILNQGDSLWLDIKLIDTSVTSIEYENYHASNGLIIFKNYPNPFHETTTIELNPAVGKGGGKVPPPVGGGFRGAAFDFMLYDLSGRIVKKAGYIYSQKLILSREGLKDGIYFYSIKNNQKQVIGRGKLVVK